MWVVSSGVRTPSACCSLLILISTLLVTTGADPSNQQLVGSINMLKDKVKYANDRLDELEGNLKIKLTDFLAEELEELIEKKLNETFVDPIERLEGLKDSVYGVQETIDGFQISHGNSMEEIQNTHEDIHNTIKNFWNFSEDSFDNITDNVNIFREIHSTSVQNILKTVENVERCPEGFFKAPGTNQCMKVFMDNNKKLTWEEADQKCKNESLRLAKPYNAVDLTNYLVERYGQNYYWVGARGNGSHMVWQSEEQSLLIESHHLWTPGEKSEDQGNADSCLTLFAMNENLKDNPGKPYYPATCKDNDAFPLCECKLARRQTESFYYEECV